MKSITDLSKLSKSALSAAMRGGTELWGQMASADMVRYMEPKSPKARSRCQCGCKKRATHIGMANGLALMDGCELRVRRWVRDGR